MGRSSEPQHRAIRWMAVVALLTAGVLGVRLLTQPATTSVSASFLQASMSVQVAQADASHGDRIDVPRADPGEDAAPAEVRRRRRTRPAGNPLTLLAAAVALVLLRRPDALARHLRIRTAVPRLLLSRLATSRAPPVAIG